MSLRLRLLLTLAPLFILGLAAADAGTYAALQTSLLQGVDKQLVAIDGGVMHVLQNPGGQRPPGGDGGIGQQYAFPAGTYGEFADQSGPLYGGALYGGYVDTTTTSYPVLPATIYKDSNSALTVPGAGTWESYRVYVTPTNQSGTELVAAIPLDGVDSTLSTLLLFEIAISSGITIIVLVVTWLLVRRGMRPLERMGATARSIAAGGLGRRVAPSNERTEVGRLGLALNAMLGQLERAFAERDVTEEKLRHFVSDASHELRTPLTSMRGYAELLQRNPDMTRDDVVLAVRRIEDETRRMGMLVDDLLLLARLDQGRPLDTAPVDLTSMVNDAVSDARAADPGRAVIAHIETPLVVTGDDLRLRQAVANLVRNALVHTPAGSPVEVALLAQNGHAEIDVIDHGPGVPAAQRERIFERFHRADPLRSRDQGGSGLGLSIATAVVSAHGGRISVADTPGGGATFRIELPVTPGTTNDV
ncbi:MAG TPA: HAMP domain-containing sensor histidine kinase [Candidatus Dormibacteraeota bacterium]|jgi:two-component system OmpR family sensor kinase|nr:HAMP domain-containing sensor histidine kinase [Candidatus Dormibacteraeota bacterium]